MQGVDGLFHVIRPIQVKCINAGFKLLHAGRADDRGPHEAACVTEFDRELAGVKSGFVCEFQIRLDRTQALRAFIALEAIEQLLA